MLVITVVDMKIMGLMMKWSNTKQVGATILLSAASSFSATAIAETEYEVGLVLGVSRTDNVLLAPPPNEIDDIVYRVAPNLGLTHTSQNLDAEFAYRYESYRYDDLDVDSSYHMFDGRVTGSWVDDSLTLEVGASRSQVVGDLVQDILPGRLPLSGNLVDRDIWYVTPRFYQVFAAAVALDVNYQYAETRYELDEIQTDRSRSAGFGLDNYLQGQGLTWALRYSWRAVDYELSLPWEFQTGSAELGFWAGSNLRIFGSAGKESAFDDPIDRSLQDSFWEAGFAYSITDEFSAEFAAGERSFGASFRGMLDYTFRRGSTSLSYAETPTALGFNNARRRTGIGAGTRGVTNEQGDFLAQPGAAEYFISNRLDWNLTITGRRTDFDLTIFDEDRESRFSVDAIPLADQEQRGLSASFSWQAGTRTAFVLSGSFVDRRSGTRDDEFRRGSIAVNYTAGARTDLSLTYTRIDQKPIGVGITREYVSNVVSLLVIFTL